MSQPNPISVGLGADHLGTPAVKTAGVYDVVGRWGVQLKFLQGGLGHQPQEKGGGP